MIFISNLWMIVNQFSPYLILGCLIAGILSIFLTVEIVQKYLGKGKGKSNEYLCRQSQRRGHR